MPFPGPARCEPAGPGSRRYGRLGWSADLPAATAWRHHVVCSGGRMRDLIASIGHLWIRLRAARLRGRLPRCPECRALLPDSARFCSPEHEQRWQDSLAWW